MKNILSLDDFERAAERRLPSCIFAYVEGGTETNSARTANRKDFGLNVDMLMDNRMVIGTEVQITIQGELVETPEAQSGAAG